MSSTTLIVLNPDTTSSAVQPSLQDPHLTFTLFLPTKHTSPEEFNQINALRQELNLPPQNHLTIPISAIVQKTWRILKHYSPHQAVPAKDTPDRQKDLKKLREINQKRLETIEKAVRDILIQDQATKLQAKIITP